MLIIDEFKNFLLNQKGFALSTINNYATTMEMLDDYIKSITFGERGVEYPHTIQIEDIEEFALREKTRGKSVVTVNNYLAGIKMFLKFCMYKGLKTEDYKKIIFAKEPQMKIEALSLEDSKKLLYHLKTSQNKQELTKTRDYGIGLVLLYGGLRVSELCNLKIIDFKTSIQVIGKGGSRRLVYLYEDYVNVVNLYLFLRRKYGIHSDYVFVSHSQNSLGKPLSRASVEKIISEAGKEIGIKVRPHKLRHTCATQMLTNGGRIEYISQILGHKNITTTQTYLDYANDDLKKTQFLIPKV